MELGRRFVAVFIFLSLMQCVFSAETDTGESDIFKALVERIDLLEARDEEKNVKIAEMESVISRLKLQMNEMEMQVKQKEAVMVDEIDGLKKTLDQLRGDTKEHQMEDRDDIDRPLYIPHKVEQRRSSFRKDRDSPENEVAFYATHTNHGIYHLGANQVLLFQKPITNVGNAYNNNTGAFVAPVDGTYVFNATVTGDLRLNNHTHMRAAFDVNGIMYSNFYVTDRDQSSQMLVINLKTGYTVTVRNVQADDGFIGEQYSTFCGFLLYQNYGSSVLVG